MDISVSTPLSQPEAPPAQAELTELILRHCPSDGRVDTAVPGLTLFRGSSTQAPVCAMMSATFATMAQGAKRIELSGHSYDYDARHYLISSVDLPMFARVTRASPEQPYLGVAVALDALVIAQLVNEIGDSPRRSTLSELGLAVAEIDDDLRDTVLRLARLVDAPQHIPVLAPIVSRELHYRLLTGALGARLRQVAIQGSHGQQIVRVISWIREHIDQPLHIDELASLASMSRSSLHHHFRALTALSPLQYQKQLRLHEARRLMLVERIDAASAAHRVGYESPSQFNREYRRMFGAPPARDIAGFAAS
ncbi:MAG: AraC family transcriptional regulator [Rhodocyclaceae bacterium]|nr:AraC family transcriptional regulator [Rhodocyclaceae bacterium]